ncbi:nitrogen fixation protein FixH [Hydrogenophaga taeniospiralis]|uniref:nitrogen fixation protein FixH n=1 Tax=Hydrogenophaga taeniospiralis TaxID=65656 RepID=UPI001CFAF48E|nr:nitrogen fixation protein FixH [Hydrogenophaga taeniospiralis]
MNTATLKNPDPKPSVSWWRVPHMWLVVGGPLLVVVASIITAVIAVKGADPVLDKEDYERNLQAARSLQGQARIDALIQLQPAHQARNHAASPVVPTDE